MSEQQMNNEISAFEARLGRLRPAGGIDAAELMFQAGRAAGAESRRRWQCVAAAAMVLAVAAATLSVTCPRTRVVEVQRTVHNTALAAAQESHTVHVPAVPATEPASPAWAVTGLSENSYLRLRDKVLADGVDALPEATSGSPEPQPSWRLLNELLRL